MCTGRFQRVSLCAATLGISLGGAASHAEPLEIRADYQADAFSVVDGGVSRGGTGVDLFAVGLDADLGAAWGWDGAAASVTIQRSNGGAPSGRIGELQAISSVEAGDDAVRLFEAWLAAPVGLATIKVGLIDLNVEFDSSEPRGLFLQSSQGIGPEFAGSGEAGPSIYPVSGLGVLARTSRGAWSFALGGFDGRPGDPDDPEAFADLNVGGDDGALVVAEIARSTDGGLNVAFGAWGYSTELERLPRSASDPGGVGRGSYGGYVGLDGPISAPTGELRAFLRLGAGAERYNAVDTYVGAGVTWNGPLDARPDDAFGLSIGSAGFSDGARFLVADSGGVPADREHAWELTYAAAVTSWFSVQPTLAYVINPGGREDIDDALAIGARISVSLSAPVSGE